MHGDLQRALGYRPSEASGGGSSTVLRIWGFLPRQIVGNLCSPIKGAQLCNYSIQPGGFGALVSGRVRGRRCGPHVISLGQTEVGQPWIFGVLDFLGVFFVPDNVLWLSHGGLDTFNGVSLTQRFTDPK